MTPCCPACPDGYGIPYYGKLYSFWTCSKCPCFWDVQRMDDE